jgi:hypothetical protein
MEISDRITGLTGYEPIQFILLILSKDLVESKKLLSRYRNEFIFSYSSKLVHAWRSHACAAGAGG